MGQTAYQPVGGIGRKNPMRRLIIALIIGTAACSSSADIPASPAVDPYDVYVANNPTGEKVISREDAQARALLGCGTAWAPGTVDYVLAQAYRAVVKSSPFCK